MRRILLAAFAMLLLHAAPSMATECTNLALVANGGTAVASSERHSGFPISQINNGNSSGNTWFDGTQYVWPDWAGIDWTSARQINRIVVRIPSGYYDTSSWTFRRIRIQYLDATSTWVNISGRSGQDDPVIDWAMPYSVDGSETKAWDLATPVTTTSIRVLIEQGPTSGWSLLDEIEAYYGDGTCTKPGPEEPREPETPRRQCVNQAPTGTATASSVHSSGLYPATGVNNGQVESGATKGYWNDNTNGIWPDWVQVAWATPQTINRVSARIPLAQTGFPTGEITLRRSRVQYYDDATSTWVDVVGRSGQDNPVLNWTGPIGRADGSETKSFDITPVRTTKIRVLIEDGSTDGWSWLDELEAYSDCTTEETTPRGVNLALVANGGTAVASSERHSGFPISQINNGNSSGNAWFDGTQYVWPDWAGIDWTSARQINRIVVRIPSGYYDTSSWTFRRIRIQYLDATSTWVDVSGRSGQDNPVIDWAMPYSVDGSETKAWDLATPVTTTSIRVLIEQGPTSGWSLLDEIEAYWIS